MKKQLLIFTFIIFAFTGITYSQGKESLKISWPGEYKWKVGADQQVKNSRMIELIPGNETLNNWTIIGTMISMQGVKNVPLNTAVKMTFDKMKVNSPKARLVIIERGDKAKYPWIIFKIESPYFTNSKNPESQMYYIIQGRTSLYTNFVAVKQASLGPLFIEKWAKIFKSSSLVYN
jgi:hypothetical protein